MRCSTAARNTEWRRRWSCHPEVGFFLPMYAAAATLLPQNGTAIRKRRWSCVKPSQPGNGRECSVVLGLQDLALVH